MDAQAQKMTQMVAEVRAQMSTGQLSAGAAVRNDQQKGRYLRARRSFKIWPVEREPNEAMDDAIKRFFVWRMGVPNTVAQRAQLDTVRAADQARNSKIKAEFVVTFADVETRDAIKSYANGLASSKGEAGLRLDVPPCLKVSEYAARASASAHTRSYMSTHADPS